MQQESRTQIILQLCLVSLLSLFCEMLVIRWLATEIRIFAYFKNLPLMSAFLGLGLGFLATDKKSNMLKNSPIFLLYFSGLMMTALGLNLTHITIVDPAKVMLFGSWKTGAADLGSLLKGLGVILGVFALSASIFVGLGQRTGQLFGKLRPLEAYTWNVAGALAGILLFTLLSMLKTGPGIWLIVAGLLFYTVCKKSDGLPGLVAPTCLIALGCTYMFYLAPNFAKLIFHGDDYVTTVWSPYYRIDARKSYLDANNKKFLMGTDIFINYDSFQTMLDCRPESLALLPPDVRLSAQNFYDRSFHVVDGQKLDDVLILGAGTGSDVASALRCGAKHVDAVEIDRAIYEIGKQYHPEHPYDSPKVTIHIADARNYLNTSTKKYDVIVYALLDSHTAFSSLSSLRTDNYVFTAESLRQASRLLKPDGYVVVCFVCYPDWLWDRHSKDIIAGAGKNPRGYFWITSLPTGFLVFGPSIGPDTKLNMIHPPRAVNPDSAVPSITDDWPFLFLPKREIPPVYVLPVLLVLLGSLIPLIKTASTGSATPLNWQMFFLGMGFMLLEVRALSAMSLLCGATWTVNSIIIAGVMVAILAANFLASRLSARAIPPLIILALVSIGLSTLVDANSLSGLDPTLANVAGTFIYLLPLFFAGAVFSSLFKLTTNSSQSLAYNMMGGLFGITIEYASMAIGVKLLSVFAVLIYLAVLGVNFVRTKQESSAAAASPQP